MTSLPLRVALVGVGNCASALVQGLTYYGAPDAPDDGLMHPSLGGFRCGDIRVVAAFDIDRRKIGRPLEEALFAPPNCAERFVATLPETGVIVAMGPILDGCPPHMADHPAHRAFRPADTTPVEPAQVLRESGAEVVVSYLPVGADAATRAYAEACLAAGCALVNCTPSFIASDPAWAERFRAAGLPLVGDDIKSQVGATIVHRLLARLFVERGATVDRTYQLNTGGNTDFLNMLARERLASKTLSKTRAVQSQLAEPLPADDIHIGPSDYVAWQNDTKVCFLRLEGRGFAGQPLTLEARMSVPDSPNSAGVAVDAIRAAGAALRRGRAGVLEEPSAWLMKSPPRQMPDPEARVAMAGFVRDMAPTAP